MNFDILFTRFFDFMSEMVRNRQSAGHQRLPDMSHFNIEHLISDDEISDPKEFYKVMDIIPEIKLKCVKQLPCIDIYDGTYPSPIETPFKENNTVYVKHYRIRKKKRPQHTVVMINGLYLENNFYFDWWCWRFAFLGLNSVLITIPYSMKRTPKGSFSGQYVFTPELLWSALSIKQAYLDTNLLINWLKGNYDGEVGILGVSFGALMGGLYICQAKNADFVILCMPPMDVVDLLNKWNFAEQLKKLEAEGKMTMLTDPRLPNIFNMSTMTPNIPLNKIFIAKGLYDHLVLPESIDYTAKKWGGLPWLCEYPTGHINTFVLNRRFIIDAKNFIRKEVLKKENDT